MILESGLGEDGGRLRWKMGRKEVIIKSRKGVKLITKQRL